MKPGSELDAKVCAAVGIAATHWSKRGSSVQVRLAPQQQGTFEETELIRLVYPPVSTDETAAFRVVAAMREKGFSFSLNHPTGADEEAYADFYTTHSWGAHGETVAHAICMAALKALRISG